MVEFPSSAVSTWGGAVVFLNVLLTRLGVPIPAVPMLLFAGSAIAAGTLSFWPILGAAVLGALIGDGAWFTAGRLYGRKLIAALSRLSPAIDPKVDKARSLFERFGVPLVSISKFVPGLALITPPLMGTTAVDARIYAVWDLAGALAWGSFWLLGGAAAERQLHMLLEFVKARGGTVIDILLAAALVYLAFRLQQRRRERRRFADAAAVAAAEAGGGGRRRIAPPKVLDARPQTPSLEAPRRIPGALALDPHSPEQIDGALRAHDTVIYCICPDSATAVDITQRMRHNGYTRIRALRGGLDAWQRRGFPVEPLAPADELTTGKRAPQPCGEARGAITLRGFAPRSSQST
ncbi:putative membrane-associated protein [Burkholderia sp. Ch1-1]|uniref:Membrane-associated protein n=1 Tax=Paraburkholderia dioscoreae TaxID=2604047 RepID=A0A5Q4ZRT3_9BURK|nr:MULTISPECIES: VTT domain-containing protein [Paraburkholderia]EIF34849.1 putative membrane-associated protein [Burkholderia sp. Ch1-1]MDR8398974.1 VTT domain-containing protein [Paraburkholderia sp. USG1]VVD34020.1 Putative membrane-associated protein [Paraburkholderia dioscoreae]